MNARHRSTLLRVWKTCLVQGSEAFVLGDADEAVNEILVLLGIDCQAGSCCFQGEHGHCGRDPYKPHDMVNAYCTQRINMLWSS